MERAVDEQKSFYVIKDMVDSWHNLIAAQGDAIIPNLRYAEIAAPTASYVIDRRCTRVLFFSAHVQSE